MIPETLVSGDSADICIITGYPQGDGWGVVCRLVGAAGGRSFDLVPVSGEWRWRLAAGETGGMVPGFYDWSVLASRPGERLTLASGRLRILPDPASVASGGGEGFWRRLRAACEASLLRKATDDQASMEFQGRKLSRYSMAELTALVRECERQIAQEDRRRRGQRGGRIVLTRFGRY